MYIGNWQRGLGESVKNGNNTGLSYLSCKSPILSQFSACRGWIEKLPETNIGNNDRSRIRVDYTVPLCHISDETSAKRPSSVPTKPIDDRCTAHLFLVFPSAFTTFTDKSRKNKLFAVDTPETMYLHILGEGDAPALVAPYQHGPGKWPVRTGLRQKAEFCTPTPLWRGFSRISVAQ